MFSYQDIPSLSAHNAFTLVQPHTFFSVKIIGKYIYIYLASLYAQLDFDEDTTPHLPKADPWR